MMKKLIAATILLAVSVAAATAQSKMEKDMHHLEEVVVKGTAKKLVVREDTFVYNADAYKVPEGSTIEELVRRLPGAQIDDDGKVTINGKEVKKIKINGKEFMTGDTQTALKNLPTSIIEMVKAYDEKSDQARMTGVDDGEEETVLDFDVKKGMNKGILANIDLSTGTKGRYSERAMGGYMDDYSRLMVFANANNVGDRGFTSGGRGGSGNNNGLQAAKMLGINYNYEKKDKLKADVFIRWNHNDTDVRTSSASQNFVSTTGSFTNSLQQQYGRNNSWNMAARLKWTPDDKTTVIIRPKFVGKTSDSRSMSGSATFRSDPYQYSDDPLDMDTSVGGDSLWVNRKSNVSLSYGSSNTFSMQVTASRKLSKNGRSITVQGRYNTGRSESEKLSTQHVELLRKDSTYFKNRYNLTPTKERGYRLSTTYSEPIAKSTYLKLRYQYQYSNKTTDRSTYDFSKEPGFYKDAMPEYRDFDSYLLPYSPLTSASPHYSTSQSRYTRYDNYTHEIELTFSRKADKYNLNAGIMLQPQISRLAYRFLGADTVTTRNVCNFTPMLDFRYRWSRLKNLRLTYRGKTSQPDMTDMLPITDDTDPLNVKVGNPGLKPSFTNTFRLQYNNYVSDHMRTIMAFVNYYNIRNSVSNMITYDNATGGKTTQPQNINGDWSMDAAAMFNSSIDSVGNWNFNTFTSVKYVNDANYTYLTDTKVTEKNYTRTTTIGERLGIGYRNDLLEVEMNGQVEYSTSRNKLQPDTNLKTWNFQYGTDITVNAPWGTSFSTGAHLQSRRGYSDSSMNTNEFVWNAQVAQSFLKGKALTVSLQFYDILNRKSSFSRAISATQRTDTWYNSINSYCMVHVVYQFNAFGGKSVNQRDKEPDDRRDRGWGQPNGRSPFGGNGNRGGFGGGGGFRQR